MRAASALLSDSAAMRVRNASDRFEFVLHDVRSNAEKVAAPRYDARVSKKIPEFSDRPPLARAGDEPRDHAGESRKKS